MEGLNHDPGSEVVIQALHSVCGEVDSRLAAAGSFESLPPEVRGRLRADLYLCSTAGARLVKQGRVDPAGQKLIAELRAAQKSVTQFVPYWVKLAVAVALGLGTTVGWKRIVVTVGEKIGKDHLSNAQGASAELITMITISLASKLGLPVSTTHVLSSGVAGAMAVNGSGIQRRTVLRLLSAWVLTLPACVFLGAALFAFLLNVFQSALFH
jgi:inorganic phosphate transporter, PiT family